MQQSAAGKTPEESLCEMTELLLPSHCNPAGVAFGGQIMAWMDICGGTAAKRHCNTPVVTAGMDFLHFLNPVKLGELVVIKAQVTRAFTSSMEVGVQVRGENPITGEKRFCCSCYFTFVAKAAGDYKRQQKSSEHKITVPSLIPITPEQQIEFNNAEKRKILRTAKQNERIESEDMRIGEQLQGKTDGGKLAKESVVEMTQLVLPSHANTTGITFGGQVMAWMESCASISAMRHTRNLAIIVAADELHFLQPTFIGEAVLIKSQVTRVFTTSLEVSVTVDAENLITSERRHCNTAYFTFVIVDEQGKYIHDVQLPPLLPSTVEEKKKYVQAAGRRQTRLEHKANSVYARKDDLYQTVSPMPSQTNIKWLDEIK